MNRCAKCNKELGNDGVGESCNKCNRTLYETKEVEKISTNAWEEEVVILRCITKKSTLRYRDLVIIPKVINPILINEDQEKIYIKVREEYISLEEFLNNGINYEQAILLCRSILEIFIELEKNDFILDEISVADFEVNEKDYEDVQYKYSRRFSKIGKLENNYSFKENIIVPDKQSKEGLSKASNVYLFGRLFLRIILNNKSFKSTEEERYYLYNLNLFREDISYDFHEFIGKVTSLYVEERYPTMKEVGKRFMHIVGKKQRDENQTEVELNVIGKSHVGNGKLAKAIKKQLFAQDPEDYNEDAFYIDSFENKKIIAVADGVSTALYGTGKEASTLLKKNIEAVWDSAKEYLRGKEEFEKLIKDICQRTNEDIYNKVKENVILKGEKNFKGGIMASTLIITLIINNKMYYCSIGDSLIYSYNKKSGLALLNFEDNMQNEWLKSGEVLDSIKTREDKAYISNYIGEIKYSNDELVIIEPRCVVRERILEDEDIVMMCSDGIIDYIIKSLDASRNIWNKDNALINILGNEELSLEEKCNSLINTGNQNGGFDNLTVVLSQVNELRK